MGGTHWLIPADTVLEPLPTQVFPHKWLERIQMMDDAARLDSECFDMDEVWGEGRMIFSKSRPVKIVLVGTGGTGGYIVPQLYRLLYALDRPIRVILCDGDLVEEKNLGRQNFIEADLGKNKAMVLAERYSNAFGIETSYIPQYVEDEEMLEELLEPLQYPQNRYVTNQNGEAVRKVISEIVILIGGGGQ